MRNPLAEALLAAIARGMFEPQNRVGGYRGPTPPARKRQGVSYGQGLTNHFNRKRREAIEARKANT